MVDATLIEELKTRARALPYDNRKKVIKDIKETELHKHLKDLFSSMEPSYLVEVTHGVDERGKDLVIVKKDNLSHHVIGVVVKRGDIRAKTAGDVDDVARTVESELSAAGKSALKEIESQIKQSQTHEAEVKAMYARLRVSQVFVVIVGDISKRVRERLEAEVKGDTVYDLDWLVENFSNYLPSIYFEGITMSFLLKKIQDIETKHKVDDSESSYNLSEYFTEPLIAPIEMYSDKNASTGKVLKNVLERKKIPFSDLANEVGKHRRIVIVGDPGVGKSGALAKYTVDQLRAATDQLSLKRQSKVKIPILINANDVLKAKDVNEIVLVYLGGSAPPPTLSFNTLLVDALDEVPVKNRQEVIYKVKFFSEELNVNTIITSRKIDLLESPQEGFSEYELLPFRFWQAVDYLEKMLAHRPTMFNHLLAGLERLSLHFPLVPLSLRMLVKVAEDSREVPASITELYDRFFETVFGRDDAEKGIDALFDYIIKRKLVSTLAYEEFFDRNKLEIEKNEFENFLKNYGENYLPPWTAEKRQRMIDELQRTGVIGFGDKVSFKHRTFLDYFVAFYLSQERAEFDDLYSLLAQTHYSSMWQGVTFFYVGLQREISAKLLEKLLDFPKTHDGLQYSISKVMIGKLLQAGWHSKTDVKRRGVGEAIDELPIVRELFLNQISDSSGFNPTPRIFGDYISFWLSDTAFGSGSLVENLVALHDKSLQEGTKQSLFRSLNIVFALKDFVEKEQKQKLIESTVGLVEKLKQTPISNNDSNENNMTVLSSETISAEEEFRALLILDIVDADDRQVAKTVRNKLKRVARRAPKVIESLFPKKM